MVIYQSIIRSNLQYAALSALRRLPLDPGNPVFLHRAVQGLAFSLFDVLTMQPRAMLAY